MMGGTRKPPAAKPAAIPKVRKATIVRPPKDIEQTKQELAGVKKPNPRPVTRVDG